MYEIFEKLMKKKGVTPYRVSKDTGISQSTLSDWKKGVYSPKLDKIEILAVYFGVPVSILLGKEQKEKPVTKSDEQRLLKDSYVKEIIEKLNRLSPENRALAEAQLDLILTHQENSKK